jgi:uncharacterized membrane protein YphA (DoxX/SURF4 family)
MTTQKKIEWVLRIAVAGEFIGHGVFALQQKAGWFKYFDAVGMSPDIASTLLPYIGVMDLTVAALVLFWPLRAIVLWATFWGLWTALLRWPIGPDPVWDLVERSANWGAPLALLLLLGWPRSLRDLFRR